MTRAGVVELVDTQDLKSCSSNRVRVRFPPPAPMLSIIDIRRDGPFGFGKLSK